MRLSKNQRLVIKVVGEFPIRALGLFIPDLIELLQPTGRHQKHYIKQVIDKLNKNEIIYLSGEAISLTAKGKNLLRQINNEEIEIVKPKNWDGIWHLVCYDIPETKRLERNYFRTRLENFGFKKIQRSLWVLPYDCKEEIAIIAQSLGLTPFIAYLNTDSLPQQNRLIRYYDLKIT